MILDARALVAVHPHVALLANSQDTVLTSDLRDLSRLFDALAVAPLLVRI